MNLFEDENAIVHSVRVQETAVRAGVLACLDWYSSRNGIEKSLEAPAREYKRLCLGGRPLVDAAVTCLRCLTTKLPGDP